LLKNNIVYNTVIEVCSTFNLSYNGVVYTSNEDLDALPKEYTLISNLGYNTKTITKKVEGVNTSNYERIIYNKKEKAVTLFNSLDNLIMSSNNNIIRNYLINCVAYRLRRKIMQVRVNQESLSINLHRSVKQFDYQNRLSIIDSYETNPLCYYMLVDCVEDIKYIMELINKLCIYLKNDLQVELLNKLVQNISSFDKSIICQKNSKGIVFKIKRKRYKDSRNFAIVKKSQRGVYIRILNIEDKDNVLISLNVKVGNYKSLCKGYDVCRVEDIEIIMPYIIKSFKLLECTPLVIQSELKKADQI